MNQTQPLAAVVFNVFGPSSALDVDEHMGLRVLKHNTDEGVQVPWGVPVGEVEGVEAHAGFHHNVSYILFIGGVLSFARHPDALGHPRRNLGIGFPNDLLLENQWHFLGELCLVLVHFRHPVNHLVHLEQDTGLAVVVAPVVVLVAALSQQTVVEDTGLVLGWLHIRGALDHVLTVVALGRLVPLDEGVKCVGPVGDVVLVALLVPDEGGLHVLGTGQRLEAHSGVLQDAAAGAAVLPGPRHVGGVGVGVQRLVEHRQHHRHPRRQERVEDHVEHTDLTPRGTGSSHNSPIVFVVKESPEGFLFMFV